MAVFLLLTTVISASSRMFGHLYAAEALVMLGRASEALNHLLLNTTTTQISASGSDEGSETGQWRQTCDDNSGCQEQAPLPKQRSDEHSLRCGMLVNLASAHCQIGQYEKAKAVLVQLGTDNPPSSHAIALTTLKAYINLRTDNAAVCASFH
eukprot:m.120007 g.120007  ORF g.120007 m.120007 type:complete len:152 (-) comp52072_c0_seq28:201-656(-)